MRWMKVSKDMYAYGRREGDSSSEEGWVELNSVAMSVRYVNASFRG